MKKGTALMSMVLAFGLLAGPIFAAQATPGATPVAKKAKHNRVHHTKKKGKASKGKKKAQVTPVVKK